MFLYIQRKCDLVGEYMYARSLFCWTIKAMEEPAFSHTAHFVARKNQSKNTMMNSQLKLCVFCSGKNLIFCLGYFEIIFVWKAKLREWSVSAPLIPVVLYTDVHTFCKFWQRVNKWKCECEYLKNKTKIETILFCSQWSVWAEICG